MLNNIVSIQTVIPAVPAPTSPVLSGLRYWYDANDNSTLTSSASRVSAITNKASGYAWTLSQATSGKQPLIVTNSQNAKQILQYTNARGDALTNFGTGNPMLGATSLTNFLVVKSTSTTNGYKFCYGANGGGVDAIFYQLSSKNYYEAGSGVCAVTGTYSVNGLANIQVIVSVSGSAANQKTYVSGTAQENITGASGTWSISDTSAQLDPRRVSIGAGYNDSLPTDFNFCEALSYPSSLSAGDIASNVSYLTAKWGL